jgi:FtsH-binding integral membrane protein
VLAFAPAAYVLKEDPMNIDTYTNHRSNNAGFRQGAIDAGLRRYMLSVYNYMAVGLGLTGLVAAFAAGSGFYEQIAGTPLIWLVMLAPLAAVLFLSFRIERMSFATAQTVFWVYAGLMGLSLAGILLVYTGSSVARVFFISAGTFAAMSLYGYSTGRDLSRFGSFLFMGLVGIILASVVNIFVASSMLHFAISVIGVLVFTSLTAYDTQRIKEIYFSDRGALDLAKLGLSGALTLYLDFINLFVMLLQLTGERRER